MCRKTVEYFIQFRNKLPQRNIFSPLGVMLCKDVLATPSDLANVERS